MNDRIPPVRPPRAKRSGCVTALFIVAGIAGVLLITVVVSTWLFFRSDTGQRVVGLAREGINMGRAATNAPGTEVLRANGCTEARVMSMERMFDLLGEIAPGVTNDPDAQRFGRRLVVCEVPSADSGPDCAQVARLYGDAVADAPERFTVAVQQGSRRNPSCQGIYGRDGTLLEPLEGGQRPGQRPPSGETPSPSGPSGPSPSGPPPDVPVER